MFARSVCACSTRDVDYRWVFGCWVVLTRDISSTARERSEEIVKALLCGSWYRTVAAVNLMSLWFLIKHLVVSKHDRWHFSTCFSKTCEITNKSMLNKQLITMVDVIFNLLFSLSVIYSPSSHNTKRAPVVSFVFVLSRACDYWSVGQWSGHWKR